MATKYFAYVKTDCWKTRDHIGPHFSVTGRASKKAQAVAVEAFTEMLRRNPPQGPNAYAELSVQGNGYVTRLLIMKGRPATAGNRAEWWDESGTLSLNISV